MGTQPQTGDRHLSGFGQYGTEEYTNLPAYNTIAQAFSGYLIQNGDVDQPNARVPVYGGLFFRDDRHHRRAGGFAQSA